MSISFEEAVATLTSMFPDWDEETLAALLTSNNYHVEQTIETVLSMCGDTTTTTNADPTPSNHNTANMFEERVSTGSAGSAGGGYNQYYDAQQGEAQRRASRGGSNNYPVPAPNVSKYRGAPQQLPDNFLRVSL